MTQPEDRSAVPMKHAQEERIEDNNIDSLHGRDTLARGQLGERLHDEGCEHMYTVAECCVFYAAQRSR